MGDKRIVLAPSEAEAKRIAIALSTYWTLFGIAAFSAFISPTVMALSFIMAVPALLTALFTVYAILARETGRTTKQFFFPYWGSKAGERPPWRGASDMWRAQLRLMSPRWYMEVARATSWNPKLVASAFVVSLLIGFSGLAYGWAVAS